MVKLTLSVFNAVVTTKLIVCIVVIQVLQAKEVLALHFNFPFFIRLIGYNCKGDKMKLNFKTKKKFNLLVAGCLSISGSALLFSMLGQLDIILAPWYCDTTKIWMFPLPFIFNEPISSLLGWEIIYALIAVAFIVIFFAGYILGYGENTK